MFLIKSSLSCLLLVIFLVYFTEKCQQEFSIFVGITILKITICVPIDKSGVLVLTLSLLLCHRTNCYSDNYPFQNHSNQQKIQKNERDEKSKMTWYNMQVYWCTATVYSVKTIRSLSSHVEQCDASDHRVLTEMETHRLGNRNSHYSATRVRSSYLHDRR